MLGSDSPFPLGEREVGRLVRESGLSLSTQAKILAGNAQAFFRIPAA